MDVGKKGKDTNVLMEIEIKTEQNRTTRIWRAQLKVTVLVFCITYHITKFAMAELSQFISPLFLWYGYYCSYVTLYHKNNNGMD